MIERDYTFEDGKFYDVIVGRKRKYGEAKQSYTDVEYEFGKENLATFGEAFVRRTEKLLKNTEKYLLRENLQEENKQELQKKRERLRGVLRGEIK